SAGRDRVADARRAGRPRGSRTRPGLIRGAQGSIAAAASAYVVSRSNCSTSRRPAPAEWCGSSGPRRSFFEQAPELLQLAFDAASKRALSDERSRPRADSGGRGPDRERNLRRVVARGERIDTGRAAHRREADEAVRLE